MIVRERLADRIQKRLNEAGGLDRIFGADEDRNWDFGLPAPGIRALLDDATYLNEAAARVEQDLVRYVSAFVDTKNRKAVIHRLLSDWPLGPTLHSFLGYHVHGLTTDIPEGLTLDHERPCTDEEVWQSVERLAKAVKELTGKPAVGHFTGDYYVIVTDPIPHLLWRIGSHEEGSPKKHKRWPYQPSDVSAADLIAALEETKDPDALTVADVIRNPPPKHEYLQPRQDGSGRLDVVPPSKETQEALDRYVLTFESQEKWDLTRCALVLSAAKQVEADRHVPTVKVSARPPSRQVVRMLTEPPPSVLGSNWDHALTGKGADGSFELVWRGKRQAYQLALLPDVPVSAALVKSILSELGDDGVRDWFVFHVMAERQGGTGDFNWSWNEHRELAGYGRRVANKNARDADLAESCVGRIWTLSHATLRCSRTRNGKVEWVRVGDHGLVDVPAGRDELTEAGRLTTVARIRLNKAIYRGARTGERKPYYALLHERAMLLPPHELRLAAMLAFDWRTAHETGGNVVRTARQLWEYAQIRNGRFTQRKHWPDATRSLNRVLDRLGHEIGLDWRVDGEGPVARYIIAAPPWWRDRVLHGVSPVLPTSTAGVPRTGAELAAWRKDHGLSLRALGDAVGASKDAVNRAEKRANVPLPAEWLARLAKVPHG